MDEKSINKTTDSDFIIAVLTYYTSAWCWFIAGLIFLVGSFILISMSREFINLVFYVAFMIGFVFCELFSLRAKRKLLEQARRGKTNEIF